jgi:hypothetical protein
MAWRKSMTRVSAALLVCLAVTGCAQLGSVVDHLLYGPAARKARAEESAQAQPAVARECEERVVYKHHFSERVVVERAERKANVARIEQLDTEIERLQSDLAQAEKTLITAESSLTGAHTRAQAVRAIAEARAQIEHAELEAPWRAREAGEARRKLEEADRHLRADRFGASILFASRAKRVANDIKAEARAVRTGKQAKQIGARSVRLRAHATSKSKLIETLDPRTPVFPEKVHGKWVLVRSLSGKVGWVPSLALVAVPASPASHQ